tara:strand:+ start:1704 stop:2009 length:306 start_codon:yes stop_codon:yes gene_type:complete
MIERDWGTYEILAQGEKWLTKRLVFEVAAEMKPQVHRERNETWLVVAGYGTLFVEGLAHVLSTGEGLKVMRGQWHHFYAGPFGAVVIETWFGELDEEDIER